MATIFGIQKRHGFSNAILLMTFMVLLVLSGSGRRTEAAQIPTPRFANQPRLVSMQRMSELEGSMCEWIPGAANLTPASFQQQAPRTIVCYPSRYPNRLSMP